MYVAFAAEMACMQVEAMPLSLCRQRHPIMLVQVSDRNKPDMNIYKDEV